MKTLAKIFLWGTLPLMGLLALSTGCGSNNSPASPAPTPTHVPYSGGPTTLVSSGLYQPYGIIWDSASGAGDLWILSDSNPGTIYQYNGSTGANVSSSQYYTGTSSYYYPYYLSTDPNGYLYVADVFNNQVEVLTAAGSYVSKITGLTKPSGVAINSAGTTLYVSEDTSPVTTLSYSITGAGYPKTYTSTANSFPTSAGAYTPSRGGPIVLDASGNVYERDFNGTEIIKYHPDGSAPATFVAAGLQPMDMAFDSSGNLFVTEQTGPSPNDYVQEYNSSGSASVSIGGFASGANLTGITVDSSGTLYVADSYNECIYKVTK